MLALASRKDNMDWVPNSYHNMDYNSLKYESFIKNAIHKMHATAGSGVKADGNGFGMGMGMETLDDNLANEMYNTYNGALQRNVMVNSVVHSTHTLMASSSYNLQNQMQRNIGSRRYPCKMCAAVFDSKTEYQMHFQHHMREPKPYKCSQCPKAFANSSYLSQHMRIHLGIKPYPCDVCKKRFTQLSHLQQHHRTHTGDKPYKCPAAGCTKAFSQLSNLQSHSRCHQTDKPFKCNSCYKCFYDEASLLEHIPKHKDSKHLKTHICKYCGKSYTQETYLARHMAKHLDKIEKNRAADTASKTSDYSSASSTVSSGRQEDFMTNFPPMSYSGYSAPFNHLGGFNNGATGYGDLVSNSENALSAFCIPANRPFMYGHDGMNYSPTSSTDSNKSGSMPDSFNYDLYGGRSGLGGFGNTMPTMLDNRATGTWKEPIRATRQN